MQFWNNKKVVAAWAFLGLVFGFSSPWCGFSQSRTSSPLASGSSSGGLLRGRSTSFS